MLQCGIVLILTRSKTIPCISPASAADGSPAVYGLKPKEADTGLFVLSNADIPSRENRCRIWHAVFFGLLNSTQHYVKNPQWLLDREEKEGGEKEERLLKKKDKRRGEGEWRTNSQIGMDLGRDEIRLQGLQRVKRGWMEQ
ncbi:hypothetical protein PBY51_005097 [Eleginops maclovinus]|uniref:Uncharacterized protein n=1 Tax=Eleginops maclovinus TaxID=56733 RepID=A0AAN7X6L7_ELEMC|nr:hypothetical protein PBY51_005097 [Eleginops maclovinus]